MKLFTNLKLKFTLIFVMVGVIPAIILGVLATSNSLDDVTSKVYNQLTAINQIKKQSIKTYFGEREADMGILVEMTVALQGKTSGQASERLMINDSFYQSYIKKYGYYDLFLIKPDGDIFYTAAKEADLNTNILNGKYSSSNLATLIKQIDKTKQYGFVDFAPYAPSNDEPAAFIGQPVLDNQGQIMLYLVLQLPIEGIQAIMGVRDGMGKTGESYLVGEDLRMRSNSFLDPNGHSLKRSFAGTVEKNGVDTLAVRRALAGESSTDIILDYNGNSVLSSFDVIYLENFKWVILSEIDESEAFASINSNLIFIAFLILGVLIGVALTGFFVANKVTTPIIKLADVAQQVAKGDLSINIKQTSNDEVGQLQAAIQQMITNLAGMVSDISGVTLQQASASEELAAITTQTSMTVAEQQETTEQLSVAMQQMGETVNEVAINTTNTASTVDSVKELVISASGQLDHTYSAILTMIEQIQQSEHSVQKVKDDFGQVVNVLGIIRGIADQTNLLALNAAIEAARAGEKGRGFAVVADEVRTLAKRTQESTEEIDEIIKAILLGANSSVEIMSQSVTQANAVHDYAKEVTELNKVITVEMENISNASTQIATATEEQSVVVDQILQNVELIGAGVVETNQATEHIAASSVELANLAIELEKETSFFKVA